MINKIFPPASEGQSSGFVVSGANLMVFISVELFSYFG